MISVKESDHQEVKIGFTLNWRLSTMLGNTSDAGFNSSAGVGLAGIFTRGDCLAVLIHHAPSPAVFVMA